ncbi:YEATS domain-containing protein 2 [Homalodisca vitripennis]|nr:YEATS domain-containing protein 2 [Homalodisca vitripennis]
MTTAFFAPIPVVTELGEDGATHKWIVYVRSAPGSLEIEQQVASVCFYLHPTYKPHNIVTAPYPPFTLNRRGWGEFPLRVELSFKNNLNKPADIIHNINLNGSISGHHTRSSETYLDLWLYPNGEAGPSHSVTSRLILDQASDLMKENVPDFSTDLICFKCQESGLPVENSRCACDASNLSVFDDQDSSSINENFSGTDFIPDMITSLPMDCETDPHTYVSRNLETPEMSSVNFGMEHSSRRITNYEVSSLSDIVKNVIGPNSCPNFHVDLSKLSLPFDFDKNAFEKGFLDESTDHELDLIKVTDFTSNNSNDAVNFSSDIDFSEILEDLVLKETIKEEPVVFEGSNTGLKLENLGTSTLHNCSIKIEDNICMSSDVSTNHVTSNHHTPPEIQGDNVCKIPEELLLPDFFDSEFPNLNTLHTNDTNLIDSEFKFADVPCSDETNFINSGFYPLNAQSTCIEDCTLSKNDANFLDTGFASLNPYQSFDNHPNESERNFKMTDLRNLSQPSCSHSDSQSEQTKIITEENFRKDTTMVIEEIPIHEFIDNIVEEIVVDIPKEELSNSDSSQLIRPDTIGSERDASPVEELPTQTQNIEENQILADVPSSTARTNQDSEKVISEKGLPLSSQKPESVDDKNIHEIVQCSKKLKYDDNLRLPNMPKGGASLLESLKTNAVKKRKFKTSTKSSVISCLQNRGDLQNNVSGSTSLLKSNMNKNSILKQNLNNESKQVTIPTFLIQQSTIQPTSIANVMPSIPQSGQQLTINLPNSQPSTTTNTSEAKKPVPGLRFKPINNPRNFTLRPGMKQIRLVRMPNGVNQITLPTSFIQQSRPVISNPNGVINRTQLQNALLVARSPTRIQNGPTIQSANNMMLGNKSTTQNAVQQVQNCDKKVTPVTLVKGQVNSSDIQSILLNQQGLPKNSIPLPKIDYRNRKLITKPIIKHEILKQKSQNVKNSQNVVPQSIRKNKNKKTDLLEMCIQKSELSDILTNLEDNTSEPEHFSVCQLTSSSNITESILKNTSSAHQINSRNDLTSTSMNVSTVNAAHRLSDKYQITNGQHSLFNQKMIKSLKNATNYQGSNNSPNFNTRMSSCSKITQNSNSLLKKTQKIVVKNLETSSQTKMDSKQVTTNSQNVKKTDVKSSCTKKNNSSITLKLDHNNTQVTTNVVKTQSSKTLLSSQKYNVRIDGKNVYLQPINSTSNENIKCTIVENFNENIPTQVSHVPKYVYIQKQPNTPTSSFQEEAITHAPHIQSTEAEGSSISLNVGARRLQPEISLNELIDITNFPKVSVPIRSTNGSPSGTNYEYEDSQLENILSCNNLHSDLDGPNLDFGRRTVLTNRDHIGSENDQEVLYYLQQHR